LNEDEAAAAALIGFAIVILMDVVPEQSLGMTSRSHKRPQPPENVTVPLLVVGRPSGSKFGGGSSPNADLKPSLIAFTPLFCMKSKKV
jgi:hypothetical protein